MSEEMMDCLACDGTGIDDDTTLAFGERPCIPCGGSGRRSVKEMQDLGQSIMDALAGPLLWEEKYGRICWCGAMQPCMRHGIGNPGWPGNALPPGERLVVLDMVLACPLCGLQHIETGEYESIPHRRHKCAHCGCIWPVTVRGVTATSEDLCGKEHTMDGYTYTCHFLAGHVGLHMDDTLGMPNTWKEE